ncbi:MAG: metal-dependent hydrolase [Desulfovibrionaceae bacterium]
MANITWYGHSAFKISSSGISIIVDPFLDGCPTCPISWKDVGPVDLVLVTHDHGDHTGKAVDICKASGAMLGCVVGTAENMVHVGVPAAQICNGIGFGMGGTVTVRGARVTMVPAFHTSDSGLPVGYIVTMPDGFTWYHAGDTCVYGDMALWGNMYSLDVALLPIGGTFTMDAAQAAVACTLLRPHYVIPMHWGTFPVLADSTEPFKEALHKNGCRAACVDMVPGDTVQLEKIK